MALICIVLCRTVNATTRQFEWPGHAWQSYCCRPNLHLSVALLRLEVHKNPQLSNQGSLFSFFRLNNSRILRQPITCDSDGAWYHLIQQVSHRLKCRFRNQFVRQNDGSLTALVFVHNSLATIAR